MRLSVELRKRTKAFASGVIRIYVKLPKQREEVNVLARQVLRSGTSVAAHAREASRARSDAEFRSKIGGLLQEADETQLWLELLIEDCHIQNPKIQALHGEANEFIAIFTAMLRKRGGE